MSNPVERQYEIRVTPGKTLHMVGVHHNSCTTVNRRGFTDRSRAIASHLHLVDASDDAKRYIGEVNRSFNATLNWRRKSAQHKMCTACERAIEHQLASRKAEALAISPVRLTRTQVDAMTLLAAGYQIAEYRRTGSVVLVKDGDTAWLRRQAFLALEAHGFIVQTGLTTGFGGSCATHVLSDAGRRWFDERD